MIWGERIAAANNILQFIHPLTSVIIADVMEPFFHAYR